MLEFTGQQSFLFVAIISGRYALVGYRGIENAILRPLLQIPDYGFCNGPAEGGRYCAQQFRALVDFFNYASALLWDIHNAAAPKRPALFPRDALRISRLRQVGIRHGISFCRI